MGISFVFLFSGQGSQYYHMGRDLFENHSVFRRWMFELDDIVRDVMGESVIDHLYDKQKRQSDLFNHILFSHPAIFMVEYSLAQAVLESGIKPDYLIGSSLGEFASSACANVLEVKDLLKAVLTQAECIETYCEKGSMCAIIHDAALYNSSPVLYENSELASINYESHFVVSGRKENISEIERYLKSNNIIYQSLPVSYGFHSSCIDPAATVYKGFLREKTYETPRIPFFSCQAGTSITDIPTDYLWRVVRHPIQFPKAIQELESGRNRIYIDLGPGGTLANFAKRNVAFDSTSECFAVMTQFNQDLKNLGKINRLFSGKSLS